VSLPADDFARVLWSRTAGPPPAAPPLSGDAACDVAIVGAGLLGLSTALALAGRGARVVVLEAAAIGAGASGRNGGLVVPSLPRIGPDQAPPALAALIATGADAVFALIRRHAIACDAVQSGWLHPAHAAAVAPRVAARAAAWQAAGARCVWLDAAATQARMGSAQFHGALFDPSGGHLDPLGYTRGLARAALAAGAAVHERTPVLAVSRTAGAWRLRTPHGTVRADRVLQATNAMPPGIGGRPTVVPLLVYQLATPPLPQAARRAVLPGNEAFSDTRNNLLAARWTAEGRLVTGGMAALHAGALSRLPRRLAQRLAATFPALGAVRFEHVWRGRAALTGDFLPRLVEPASGWLSATACNGRGIVLATVLGPALAAFLATGDAQALPLPVTPPRPIPFPALARRLPQMLLPLGDWQDRRAARG
jgi:glycine/D-amino acid oxidase-like deaminating enzyme